MSAPVRAFRLTLRLDADTAMDLANALFNLSVRADRGELTVGTSGGSSSGYSYELLHSPEQTHEKYFAELNAYLDAALTPAPAQPEPPTLADEFERGRRAGITQVYDSMLATPPTLTEAQCDAIGRFFVEMLSAPEDMPDTDEELRALIRAAAAGGA